MACPALPLSGFFPSSQARIGSPFLVVRGVFVTLIPPCPKGLLGGWDGVG